MDDLPPFVRAERDALIAEVYEAFAGVSRDGGISWSESYEVDGNHSLEVRALARAQDLDTDWTQVVEDPDWQGDAGIGGWNFLDAIGYRYYLPVQMVRCLQTGEDIGCHGIAWNLTLPRKAQRDWRLGMWKLLDGRQRRCVKRFLRYMAVVANIVLVPPEVETDELSDSTRWEDAYWSYWKAVPDEGEPTAHPP